MQNEDGLSRLRSASFLLPSAFPFASIRTDEQRSHRIGQLVEVAGGAQDVAVRSHNDDVAAAIVEPAPQGALGGREVSDSGREGAGALDPPGAARPERSGGPRQHE